MSIQSTAVMDLIQIRYAPGGLQYRQRLTVECHCRDSDEYWKGVPHLVLSEWGPWQFVPAVKSDASDAEKWGEE